MGAVDGGVEARWRVTQERSLQRRADKRLGSTEARQRPMQHQLRTPASTTDGSMSTIAACPTKFRLDHAGMVRSDIRPSFAGLRGTADGVPLTIALTLVSASSCTPLAGYAVSLWHCDRGGNYSLYSSTAANQNYLRSVQPADASGKVTFTSIFPACYSGRWPHIHFEVYPSLAAATAVKNKVATSQIALPKTACDVVYATSGYSQSVSNLSQISLSTDMVFSDGASLELATITGDVSGGMTAALTVAISV